MYDLVFRQAGQQLLSGNKDRVSLWNIPVAITGTELRNVTTATLSSLAFSLDGQWVALGGDDGRLLLSSLTPGLPFIRPFAGRSSQTSAIAFQPDGRSLASAGTDGNVAVWDISSGQALGNMLIGHTAPVNQVLFDPNSNSLLSGGQDGSILAWDLARRVLVTSSQRAAAPVSDLLLATDGRLLTVVQARGDPAAASTPGTASTDQARGIDVSKFNQGIDWPAVRADGIAFAYIKATEGTNVIDPRFAENWQGAKTSGIVRGAYHFFRPMQDAAAQADQFVDSLGGDFGEIPPMLILDTNEGVDSNTYIQDAQVWLTRVENRLRVKPVIYTGAWFWDPYIPSLSNPDLAQNYELVSCCTSLATN